MTAPAVTGDRSRLKLDVVASEVIDSFFDGARPDEAQVAAARSDRPARHQRPDVEARPVDVELLIAKPIGDATVGVVNNLGTQDLPVERCRAFPLADRDHAVVEPDLRVSHAPDSTATAARGGTILDMLSEDPNAARRMEPSPPPQRSGEAGSPVARRVPVGRTPAEIHLYIDLHPCECGEGSFPTSGRQYVEDGSDLVVRYNATCPRCGRERSFSFRLTEQPIQTGPEGARFRYGDEHPSELLDPGEWLIVADAYSKSVPMLGSGATDQERARFQYALGRAAAAIDEVVKFAPPGAAEIPPSAIASARGRHVYDAEPGRFRLFRLAAVSGAYRQLLADAGLS
jgi:hypothetical protein